MKRAIALVGFLIFAAPAGARAEGICDALSSASGAEVTVSGTISDIGDLEGGEGKFIFLLDQVESDRSGMDCAIHAYATPDAAVDKSCTAGSAATIEAVVESYGDGNDADLDASKVTCD